MPNTSRKRHRTSRRTGELAFTRKEYEKLLATCGTIEDELFIKIEVSFGLRREDLVNIMIDNIDLVNNTLTYIEEKKNDRIRTVPIGANLRQVIIKYLNTIPKTQKKLFDFCGRTAYNKLQRLCDQAEIPRRPIHAMRSTCIKFCQAEKWSIEAVSELTGDSIRVIQEHYLTPSRAEMHELAADKEVI